MCGIAGIVDFEGREIEKNIIKAMCDTMVHRGPDDEGYYFGNNSGVSVGLGHRRLAIVDLKTGRQPIHNEDKSIWIICNGEIYNFIELRSFLKKRGHVFYTHSDTEVIIHGYEEYGEDVVCHLRGMFAFAIWDGIARKLILARDRIGKKPLLFSVINNKLIFASEFKAILSCPDVSKEINFEAVHHYLTYLCIPSPLTIFNKISKILPAHILVYEENKLTFKKYWELNFSKKIKLTEQEAVVQLRDYLKDAVRIRLISDVPLGVLLSGGIDSSCVTAVMSRLQEESVRTFSVGFNESHFNELPYAKLVAENFKTNHHYEFVTEDALEVLPKIIEHYGEPFGDSSALPTYYVCKAARQGVKVALNGDGGDEVFAGYRRHLANYLAEIYGPLARIINRSPFKMLINILSDRPSRPNSGGNIRRFLKAAELPRPSRYLRWIGFFDEEFKKNLYTEEFQRKTLGMDSGIFLRKLFNEVEDLDSIDAALYVDTMFGLQNDLLVKMDIASMASSLETRSPLLDHRLMEFSASLPSKFKIYNFSLKYILKTSLNGLLPDKILRKPKRGFAVPIDIWFRGKLKGYLINTILSPKAIERGYFKPETLRNIVESHLSRENDYGQHLWALLVLELWHRIFIDS